MATGLGVALTAGFAAVAAGFAVGLAEGVAAGLTPALAAGLPVAGVTALAAAWVLAEPADLAGALFFAAGFFKAVLLATLAAGFATGFAFAAGFATGLALSATFALEAPPLAGAALVAAAFLATGLTFAGEGAGRALAPDAVDGAALAVLVAGAFTAGLLSDPDDARSSGWRDGVTVRPRAAPESPAVSADAVIPALGARLGSRVGWRVAPPNLARDCIEGACGSDGVDAEGNPKRWRSETKSTVSLGLG